MDSLNQSLNDLWKFDSLNASWIPCPGIPALGRRGGVCLAETARMVYLTGIDENNQRLNEAWQFAPFLSLENPSAISPAILLETRDCLGRTVNPASHQIQLQVFSDGTVQRVFRIE
jgi:hypothetical protein